MFARCTRHVSALFVAAAPGVACDLGRPPRPASVPPGATRVAFSKEGGWAYCWLDREHNVNRCRTYNAAGERLYQPGRENDEDDVFLPDQGQGPIPESELQISPIRTSPGSIWLTNGIVLIPRNAYEGNKRLVDDVKAIMRQQDATKKRSR